ncbi:hypothetical protein F511_43329 [Dorcoceras hygrometricum]|uniref:PLATZ transcription factor family protein n=1 Tax=Dorcoceras hygrometricum TaxID=472368 RepID=A0A2Z7D360_9LAMI|nr:hypothetical protein F511_43329 [Dorcoceras hygrometricum]
MAMDLLMFPTWLRDCIETRFYDKRCEKHAGKYKTIYCGTCRGTLACEICWKDSTEHHDHDYLQVYTASWRTSISIGDISRFCDASNIQLYKINSKKVVYLNPNAKGREEKKDGTPKCLNCQRKLIESHYRFCSIACKITNIELARRDAEVINHGNAEVINYRIRRRKAEFPRKAAV